MVARLGEHGRDPIGYTVHMEHIYDYPRPALCCDTVVLCGQGQDRRLLLVRRAAEPYRDQWALPGGFVDEGERPIDAARRELVEETGVECECELVPLGAFGDPGRDPRGWTVSAVYVVQMADCLAELRAGEDAAEVRWYPLDELPAPLAFDHDEIVALALSRLECL